jgi:hypothetical protein
VIADEHHVLRVLHERGPTSERLASAWAPLGVGNGDDEAPAVLRRLDMEYRVVEVAWCGPTRVYDLTRLGQQIANELDSFKTCTNCGRGDDDGFDWLLVRRFRDGDSSEGHEWVCAPGYGCEGAGPIYIGGLVRPHGKEDS